jgi:chromosome segregation ATPase
MTNTNDNNYIQDLLIQLAQSQLRTQESLERTQQSLEGTQQQLETVTDNIGLTQTQLADTQRQLLATQFEIERVTNSMESVFSRNEILNDILLQLRDNQENLQARFDRHLQNFDESQRTTNAALEQLTAILMRLTRDDN